MSIIYINKGTPNIRKLDEQTIYEFGSRRVYYASTGKLINRWVEIYLHSDLPCVNYFHTYENALRHVQFMRKQAIVRKIPAPDMGASVSTGVGTSMGTGVSTGVSTSVGPSMGTGVGTGVGTSASTGVGTSMGTGMGTGVGTSVGTGVGTGVSTGMGTGVSKMRLNAPVFVPGK